MKGTSLQSVLPKCQYPVKAVRGVIGAATTQMRMSAMAMLQMYMLDLVCRLGLLNQIKDVYLHCLMILLRMYLMTVKMTMRLPVMPIMMIRE